MARDRSHSIWPGADRSVMVQTDYREAEAQTDLYTPEYVVLPGSQQKPQRITSNNNNGVEQYHVCMLLKARYEECLGKKEELKEKCDLCAALYVC